MGLFSWFKTKQEKATELTTNVLPEIKKEDFVDDSDPKKNNSITITYGTGMPIDLIYSFLKEDYETKGYDDALANPDLSYRENNKSIIKSNLEIKFKQVRLRYIDVLRDIDFHIYTPALDIAQSFAVMAQIALNHAVKKIEFVNLALTEECCFEWHICYEDNNGQLWQIDIIQIKSGSRYDGYFERVAETIKSKMSEDMKKTILQLKFETPDTLKIAGIEYYKE